MKADIIRWLAGPITFETHSTLVADRKGKLSDRITALRWEFVGCTAAGDLRRWSLRVNLETRLFSTNTLTVTSWERAHQERLLTLYRAVAIPRHDLPGRTLADAMRSMLTDQEIAEVTSLALRGGKHG